MDGSRAGGGGWPLAVAVALKLIPIAEWVTIAGVALLAPIRRCNVADQHSFDVVSEINHAEMHNAIVQAQHEIAVRFDFKGTRASIEFDKKENKVKLEADHKGQLDTVVQIVKEKMARRNVPVGALRRGKIEDASHDTVRETLTLHTGIETDDARKMIKEIKQLKIKVQAQIMEDKIRVTGKKIDDLQAVIAHLKAHGPEYPLQFVNLA
jgi:uncharacterized protein YajQ (UPF0234 family)